MPEQKDAIFEKDVSSMTDDELREHVQQVQQIVKAEQERHERLMARLEELQKLKQQRQHETDKKRAQALRDQLLNA